MLRRRPSISHCAKSILSNGSRVSGSGSTAARAWCSLIGDDCDATAVMPICQAIRQSIQARCDFHPKLSTFGLTAKQRLFTRPKPLARARERQRTTDLFLSVVTIGEIERGYRAAACNGPDFRRGTGSLARPRIRDLQSRTGHAGGVVMPAAY